MFFDGTDMNSIPARGTQFSYLNPTAPRGRVDFFRCQCYNVGVNRKAYGEQIFRSAFREPPAGARRQPARRTAIPGGRNSTRAPRRKWRGGCPVSGT